MKKNRTNFTELFLTLFDTYKQEKRGVLFFLSLILIVILFNISIGFWVKAPKVDTTQLDSLVEVFSKPIINPDVSKHNINVNTNDTTEWMQLGFSKRQVSAIFNYRNAIGGRFKTLNQIQNIYIIDSLKYKHIRPYLRIEKSAKLESKKTALVTKKKQVKKSDTFKNKRFLFDPNKISYDSLLLLGFSSKQASSLIKYREKIKRFYQPNDLLKLYLYNKSDDIKYRNWIVIDENYAKKTKNIKEKKYIKSKTQPTKIELNSADTLTLVSLYGIGNYSASTIIRYRNKLGGYYSTKQLYEIKNLKKKNIDIFINNLLIDTSLIKKININTCTFKELLAHPYFDFFETKLIFNYRDKNEKFISLQNLYDLEPLPKNYVNEIKHYIKFE